MKFFISLSIASFVSLKLWAAVGISLQQSQFVTDSKEESQSNSLTDVYGSLGFKHKSQNWDHRASLLFSHSAGESSETYFSSNELYAGVKYKNTSLSLGRKLSTWNEIDQSWSQALWQPSFRWDASNPIELGLTGIHVSQKIGLVQFYVLYSPVFLPDQGANVKTKNGELISQNRWFSNNISSVRLGQSSSPLYYEIQIPEVSEVVNNETYALKLGINDWKEKGPFVRLAYARKPVNKLQLAIAAKKDVSLSSNGSTQVNIVPQVIQHQVTSLEGGWKNPNFGFVVSYSNELPEPAVYPDQFIYSEWNRAEIYGLNANLQLPWLRSNKINILGSLIRVDEELPVLTSASSGFSLDGLELVDRFEFRDAYSLGLSFKLFPKTRMPLKVESRWVHSNRSDGDWWRSRLTLRDNKRISWNVGWDILGSQKEEGFIYWHKNNDRFWLGLNYEI